MNKRAGRPTIPIDREKYKLTNRLREFRTLPRPDMPEGYSQEYLAEYLGVAATTICNAERYGRSLGKRNWYKLATLFDVDPRVLEGIEEPEKILANNSP